MIRHALIIDDEPNMLQHHVRLLSQNNIHVEVSSNPSEAFLLMQSKERKIDIGVIDMRMPSGKLYELYNTENMQETGICLYNDFRRIRPETPLIIFTQYHDTLSQMPIDDPNLRIFAKLDYRPYEFMHAVKEILENHASLAQKHHNDALQAYQAASLDPLEVLIRKNDIFNCLELTVKMPDTQSSYLWGDIYSDYFALSWLTDVNIEGFIAETRKYVAIANQNQDSYTIQKPRLKEFHGVTIYIANEFDPITINVSDPYDINPEMISKAAKNKRVNMIRVASEWADFCYEYQFDQEKSQRAGIISHLFMHEPLTWLVQSTNRVRSNYSQIEQTLKNISNQIIISLVSGKSETKSRRK